MVNTLQQSQTAWSTAVLQPAQEFGPEPLTVLAGSLPLTLRGALYRNGPATLERGGQRVGHWFDGDGGILGIQFAAGTATGTYRYVQTAGYRSETQAGQFLSGGYGMLPPGPFWERWGKGPKNAANTSVLALPDKVLALWEGGPPHALTLDTLETIGLDDLAGLAGQPFSAHPKVDPQTGDIYNFGVSLGANATLNLYRCDRTGTLQQRGSIPLQGFPLIHDGVLAGDYLVFCVPPVRLNLLPLLMQLKPFSDAMTWQPERGTEILVIDRSTLELVCRIETDPWYQWHFGNGYQQPDGSIVLDIARYEDFQTNQRLKETATGHLHTRADATLWRLQIRPTTGVVEAMQPILNRSCEFPVVQPAQVGQPSRYTYLALHRQTSPTKTEVFDAIGCFDHQTHTLIEADLGANHYPSEPIYAPDAQDRDLGWILTVVYNGNTRSSEVWIYQADRLNDAPVCRLALPAVIPLSFHGTWRPG